MIEDRLMRIPEVLEVTGLSRATVYKLVAQGDFPKKVKISTRAVGFRASDIQAFVENCSANGGGDK
jgi:prophage regulatory protein